jgi:hypothetical protein
MTAPSFFFDMNNEVDRPRVGKNKEASKNDPLNKHQFVPKQVTFKKTNDSVERDSEDFSKAFDKSQAQLQPYSNPSSEDHKVFATTECIQRESLTVSQLKSSDTFLVMIISSI